LKKNFHTGKKTAKGSLVILSALVIYTAPTVKLCIAVYIISVLFVLFLVVMRFWIDLQVFKVWDFGSSLKSGWAKPAAGEACRGTSSNTAGRVCWISLLLEKGQDGLIRSSTIDAIAAQVLHNK
jgi:hypothetical protein